MIFFCFSSQDRQPVVESILFHITNFGLPVWYDRHRMLLGDARNFENFDMGIEKSSYAIVIMSRNTLNSTCACEEIEIIKQRHNSNKLQVFPIFYNMKAAELPEDFLWMNKLVYKELDTTTDSRSTCNHIVCRFLLDRLANCKIQSLEEFHEFCRNQPAYSYLKVLIESYKAINDTNHNAKISILYAGCQFLYNYYRTDLNPIYLRQGVEKLFDETKLHLPIDLREGLIFERLFLLSFNTIIFGDII